MALLTWVDALPRLMQDHELKIKLIASPELNANDLAVFQELMIEEKRAEYRRVVVRRVLEYIIALANKPTDSGVRARVLAWLVANERLDIRFAFARHLNNPGIFHEKIGIFDLPGGRHIAFTGSANETLGGHRLNYESIDVYRSWIAGDEERVQTKIEQFEEAWRNEATGLHVETPNPETVARLKARAPRIHPREASETGDRTDAVVDLWHHQEEAVAAFLAKRSGVLEMATGTGKTWTALKIFNRLIGDGSLEAIIVTTDGTDLLDQWRAEVDDWVVKSGKPWRIYLHFERHKQLGDFALDPHHAILIVSRGQLNGVLERLPTSAKANMMVVHDEVHGLGAPSQVASLGGKHRSFAWRLGLSATPERTYDQGGNQFILAEIGPIVYRFPLEAAIQRGVLAEFDYVPLKYQLTEEDRKRLRDVFAKRAARARDGNPMAEEEVWTELARVYKTAEMKPEVFREYLKSNSEILRRCIIFVETKEYGNRLLEDIHNYTTLYRTYYAEDDRDHLSEFAQGRIDCLITCHRVSQGIDIRSLQTVVLFASARSKLETIQRIGRCLRVDPNAPSKRATVVDFVRQGGDGSEDGTTVEGDEIPNADVERCEWLAGLSTVRRVRDGG